MSDWSSADLAAIDADGELRVAAHRPDGTLRTPHVVWQVVVDDHLYIRSVRGTDGAWYRGVQRTGTGHTVAADVRGSSATRRCSGSSACSSVRSSVSERGGCARWAPRDARAARVYRPG